MLTADEEAYLSTIPDDKLVRILPWSPDLPRIAGEIESEVRAVHPEIEARLSGAAALGIAGQNDIDFDFMAAPSDFERYLAAFVRLFGEPRVKGGSVAAWTFHREGIEIDLWPSNPASASTIRQWRRHCILRDSPELTREYEALKLSFGGRPYREYERAKYEFFNQVLSP